MKEQIIKCVKNNKFLYKTCIKFKRKIEKNVRTNIMVRKIYCFVQNKKIIEYSNDSVIGYAEKNKIAINILEEKKEREIYSPPIYPIQPNGKIEKKISNEIYYVILKNVLVSGENNIIIADNYCLNDKYALEYANEFQFDTGAVIQFSDNKSKVLVDKKINIIDEAVLLIGEASNNYYHWIFDILCRIIYVNQFDKLKKVPLIVDETVRRHETCLKLLEYLNFSERKIIYIEREKFYKINTLHYFSPCTWSSVYNNINAKTVNKARFMKSRETITLFREEVLKQINQNEKTYPKKIFISRRGSTVQRLVNENELAELSTKFGFEIYDPMQHSIEEQIVLFKNVDCIICDEGAALVNMLWCQNKAKIICVRPTAYGNFEDLNFPTIAYLCGLDFIYLDAETVDGVYHRVNKELFLNCIKNNMLDIA